MDLVDLFCLSFVAASPGLGADNVIGVLPGIIASQTVYLVIVMKVVSRHLCATQTQDNVSAR